MDPRTPPTPTPPLGSMLAWPAERDWIDRAIEWTSGLAAVAMFAYGVALSYAVLYAIAEAAGLAVWAGRLWPLGWELFMASAALNALAEQRHLRGQHGWRRVPWYPLALTGLTAGGSILLNWFHPAIPLDPPPGWLKSLVYGLPPLEAVLAWHLFLLRIAHRRHQAPVPAGTVPGQQRAVPEADQRDEPAGTADDATRDGAADRRGGSPPPQPARTLAGAARSRPVAPRPTAGTAGSQDAGLVAQARAAAAEHDNTHGRPISRDALRQALRVSNQTAGALLRELRADQTDLDRPPQDQDGGVAARAGEPDPAGSSQPSEHGPAAGNGAGSRPGGLAAMVPAVPIPAEDGQGEAGDA